MADSLVLPAEVKAALLATPDGRLYVQDMGAFEEDRYYEPDADVQARMTLVYSADEELRWNRHDTMASDGDASAALHGVAGGVV